jgi:hypothetical protein
MEIRGIHLMGDWRPNELAELEKILAPLPRSWVENNPSLHVLVRESVLRNAPADAPGHSKYEPAFGAIVVYDKGMYHGSQIDPEQFRRSVYHELAHSLVRSRPQILVDWNHDTDRDGFVDDYAKSSPEEDFADTFSEFLIDSQATYKKVPHKADFLTGLRSHDRMLENSDREKVAMHFMRGFGLELVKIARPGAGRLGRMLGVFRHEPPARTIGLKKGLGLAAAGAAAAGAAGEHFGKKRGEHKGYDEGTEDVEQVAERARDIGRKEGVLAYHEMLQQQLREGGKEG